MNSMVETNTPFPPLYAVLLLTDERHAKESRTHTQNSTKPRNYDLFPLLES